MIKRKKKKRVYLLYVAFWGILVALGVCGYRTLFSPEAMIKKYLLNQFNYSPETIEEMQENRECYLQEQLLKESRENGILEEKREYAIYNREYCSLQNMRVEKTEKDTYVFEVWYHLRYENPEIEDKRVHASGTMEIKRSGLSSKISSMTTEHGCEEIIEKE